MKFIIEPINETDCRITGVDCSGLQGQSLEEVTVPATVDQDGRTWQVKEVGDQVFFTNKFDEDAAKFASLRRLKKIIFSEGIEVIDGVMRPKNTNNADERGNIETFTEAVLPSTLKKIGDRTFEGCYMLSVINIPEGLEVIGNKAFYECSAMKVFPWPKKLRYLGDYAFFGMADYKDAEGNRIPLTVEIPETIENIGGNLYGHTPIDCKVSLKAWPVLVKPEKEDANGLTFYSITRDIISIDIPEGVTEITAIFSRLEKVTLPSTIEVIGDYAFADSHVLECIHELPANLKSIGEFAFKGSWQQEGIKELHLPTGIEHIGRNAFGSDWHPKGYVKIAGDEATMRTVMSQPGTLNGTAVEIIDIPEGATEVEVDDCPYLTRLTIPSTVTIIHRISECPKLENLDIPDSVIRIGKIERNESLATLRLSANLQRLVRISDCPSIKELSLPDTLLWPSEEDDNWYELQLCDLHAEIKASPKAWNLLCSKGGLHKYSSENGELVLPEGVEIICEEFLKNSKITKVCLPASLTTIGRKAFEGSSNLSVVEIAPGSQLKQIGYAAFAKTAIKEMVLPNGFTTLYGEVFKDIETLESLTFPASMTDFGFSVNEWNEVKTPVVRCKNLKQVIFLADDPATAVYPVALGKLCDWYVPDAMVDHVKAFIEKAKADNPKVKGVGAKSVKPLSKLKGGAAAEPKKKAPAKKAQALTQQIKLYTRGLKAHYRFAVDEKDMPMLDNSLDLAVLAVRYMRDRIAECSFTVEVVRNLTDELELDTQVNSATEKCWHCTPKTTHTLDFTNASALPEDFPVAKAPELAAKGGFQKLFSSHCPNFAKKLPESAPAYIDVNFDIKVWFDFMIGEKDKFNVKKITVMADWDYEDYYHRCWRFGLMYNGRYIPATSIVGDDKGFRLNVMASSKFSSLVNDPRGWRRSDDDDNSIICEAGEYEKTDFDGVSFAPGYYTVDTLPFFNEILSLAK